MTNEEKRNQIYPYYEDMEDYELVVTNAKRIGFMVGCEWKDKQNKWHIVSEGDFPVKAGEYVTVCKNKNMEGGICLYEVSYWTGSEWDNRKHYEDIVAWRELPKYEEE